MALLLNQANMNTSSIYDTGTTDTSANTWSFAWGDALWHRCETTTATNIYEKHPLINAEFWRYSISQSTWIKIYDWNMPKQTVCNFTVRTNNCGESVKASYDGDDSYLFGFRAYTYEGARSRCNERLRVYNIGENTQYSSQVLGKKLYLRNADKAYAYHLGTNNAALNLSSSDLYSNNMSGTLITTALIKRLTSYCSAHSKN
jgi:hypothetical protein